jgi:hypothetical protein
MIWDSSSYRKELLRVAAQLEKWRSRRNLTARDIFASERAVFVASYLVRKLWEAHKLTERIKRMTIPVSEFRNRAPVTAMNWHKIDVCYDLAKRARSRRDLRFICNQFIHSYVFAHGVKTARGGIEGFYFCSDRERNNQLFYITSRRFARAIARLATESPGSSHWTFNTVRGDYDVVNR